MRAKRIPPTCFCSSSDASVMTAGSTTASRAVAQKELEGRGVQLQQRALGWGAALLVHEIDRGTCAKENVDAFEVPPRSTDVAGRGSVDSLHIEISFVLDDDTCAAQYSAVPPRLFTTFGLALNSKRSSAASSILFAAAYISAVIPCTSITRSTVAPAASALQPSSCLSRRSGTWHPPPPRGCSRSSPSAVRQHERLLELLSIPLILLLLLPLRLQHCGEGGGGTLSEVDARCNSLY